MNGVAHIVEDVQVVNTRVPAGVGMVLGTIVRRKVGHVDGDQYVLPSSNAAIVEDGEMEERRRHQQ